VRSILDDVFNAENFIAIIPFRKKTMPLGTVYIEQMHDFLLWYGKNASDAAGRLTKYRKLYLGRSVEGEFHHCWYQAPDGGRHKMSRYQLFNHALLPEGSRVYRLKSLEPSGPMSSGMFDFEYDGVTYPHPRNGWGTTEDGMTKLASATRLQPEGNRLTFVLYADESSATQLTAPWTDTVGADDKSYVVQTNTEVLKRCILMTTDPGDLVFDPTCGSGTTAYVAEQWGRRWITCDTSRVPLALARQRILTATFPYYELKDSHSGPSGGFVFKRKQNRKGEEIGGVVPHITLKSIANDEPPAMEVLVDRPEVNDSVTRVSGPFVVEATIAPTQTFDDAGIAALPGVRPLDTALADADAANAIVAMKAGDIPVQPYADPATHLDRMTEVLRQSKKLNLPGNRELVLSDVRRTADSDLIHAEALGLDGKSRIAIVFGPEDGAISSDVVYNAASEALYLKYTHVYFFGFAIQAKARELIEDRKKLRIACTYVAVTPDVVLSDLLKTTRASEIFSITGLPDIDVKKTGEKNDDGAVLWQVELRGLDIFNPGTMKQEEIEGQNVPAWMLDTDYDGMSFFATQVFFPKTAAWDNLQKSLKATFDPSTWEHLAGTTSEPFVLGNRRRIAVKVIDERGNELMRVVDVTA
jgi:adenine-specific DNA-methyltransferase